MIPNTCPNIDKVISALSEIESAVRRNINSDNIKDLQEALTEIENEVWGLDRIMEELRDANSRLRDWAEDKEEECKTLQEQLDKIRDLTY